jgi:S-adenosylmethionine:diacylglycerol 3-amino-3-carboxypropyl transferase
MSHLKEANLDDIIDLAPLNEPSDCKEKEKEVCNDSSNDDKFLTPPTTNTPNIMFSQVREDPQIEIYALSTYLEKPNLNIMLIGSGGCTLFSLLSNRNITNIDVVDSNVEQLYLIQLKHVVLKTLKNTEAVVQFFEGKFDKEQCDNLMIVIRDQLSDDCAKYWQTNVDLIYCGINQCGKFEKLFCEMNKTNYDFVKVFDRKYLEKIFGKDAVAYSLNTEFSEHFANILTRYKTKSTLESNYFHHQFVCDSYSKTRSDLPPYLTNIEKTIIYNGDIEYHNLDGMTFLHNTKSAKYDCVHLSNIADWMSVEKVQKLLSYTYRSLNSGGLVIVRKLNGDHNLTSSISEFFEIMPDVPEDRSYFYKEIVIGRKK